MTNNEAADRLLNLIQAEHGYDFLEPLHEALADERQIMKTEVLKRLTIADGPEDTLGAIWISEVEYALNAEADR